MGSDYFDVRHYFVDPSRFNVQNYLDKISPHGTYHRPVPFVIELYTSVDDGELSEEEFEDDYHDNMLNLLKAASNFPEPSGPGVIKLHHNRSGTTQFSYTNRTYLDLITSMPLNRAVIREIISLLSTSRSLGNLFESF